jgi:two-component system, response regulator
VVLLDLRLPKVSGLDVLREIKTNNDLRTIPVVILTTSTAERDVVSAYAQHANSYLVKPVDFVAFTRLMHDLGLYWFLRNYNSLS